ARREAGGHPPARVRTRGRGTRSAEGTTKNLRGGQGALERQMARLGMPTGGQVNRILTPAKIQVSSSGHQYLAVVRAAWLVGYPLEFGGNSQYMERGKEQEPEARAWYELTRDVEVEQVGFIMT